MELNNFVNMTKVVEQDEVCKLTNAVRMKHKKGIATTLTHFCIAQQTWQSHRCKCPLRRRLLCHHLSLLRSQNASIRLEYPRFQKTIPTFSTGMTLKTGRHKP